MNAYNTLPGSAAGVSPRPATQNNRRGLNLAILASGLASLGIVAGAIYFAFMASQHEGPFAPPAPANDTTPLFNLTQAAATMLRGALNATLG